MRAGPLDLRGLAAGVGFLLLTGCYSYTPIALESVQPPQRVRAFLSPAGAERVEPLLNEARQTINGELVEVVPEGIYLEFPSAYVQSGMRTETLTQRLLVPHAEVLGLQRRQLDRARTVSVVAVASAAVGLLVYKVLTDESGGTTTPPPGGGPPEARLPLFRISAW